MYWLVKWRERLAEFKASLILRRYLYKPLAKMDGEELYMLEKQLENELGSLPTTHNTAVTDMPYVLAILRVREVRRYRQGGF